MIWRLRRGLQSLERFRRSTDGAFSVLTAILALVIVGFTGLAVDLGSVIYWQKRLQSATDAAALAATFDYQRSQSIAETAMQANAPSNAAIDTAYVGNYVDDPSLAATDRFVLGAPENAVRLTTRYDVPVHFVPVLTGSSSIAVTASALAYNLPLAGLAVGTGAADADNAQTNAYFQALTGNYYNLTDAEIAALNASRISIFRTLDQLAAASGSRQDSIEADLAANVTLPTLANAAASALAAQASSPTSEQTTAIGALTRIGQQSSNTPAVTVSNFLTLSAHQKRAAKDMVSARTDTIGVPAMSLLLGYLQMSRQDTLVNTGQTITLPGLATITVEAVLSKSAIGGGAPGIAMVGPAGSSATSSQGRVRLTITALQPIHIDVGPIHLALTPTIPLIADVGYGSATISGIACGTDIKGTTDVSVAAQSGAARLYIGNVNNGQLTDLAMPLTPLPATIISTPLVSVTASSQTTIAQSANETVHFTWDDIEQGVVKTVDGSKSLGTALTDLNDSLAVTVGTAPAGTGALISNLLTTQVDAILTALAPELNTILASLGLRAGYMELRATASRCGIPALAS